MEITFREKNDNDNEWIKHIATVLWGSEKIISKDKIYDTVTLPGFIAE